MRVHHLWHYVEFWLGRYIADAIVGIVFLGSLALACFSIGIYLKYRK